MPRIALALTALASLLIGLASLAAWAQVAPSAAQIAAYDGLHRAAHENDAAAIRRLVVEGADVEAHDANGRRPLHVAAFASNDAALRALAEAGADMNALEGGLYDAVTIAAVADDPVMVSLAMALGNRADLVTSIYDGTALIAAAHLGHAEVVRMTSYLTTRDDFAAYMAVRDAWLAKWDAWPTSTLLIGSGFARPEFLLEVEVTAAA